MDGILDASKLRLRGLRSEAEGIVALLSSSRPLSDSRATTSDLIAAELGGAISESLFGVGRIGKAIGRSISRQSRVNQKRQLEASSRSRALGIVSQVTFELTGLAGRVNERKRLALLATLNASLAAAHAITIARTCVRVISQAEGIAPVEPRPRKALVRPPGPPEAVEVYILRSFEQDLRDFIATQLSDRFPEWWSDRVPEQVRAHAEYRKKQRERTWPWSPNGDSAPIHFVDFKDYALIITDPRNWSEVFQPVFGDMEIVRVKLRELEPIRVDLSHARSISDTGARKLRLYAEEFSARMSGRTRAASDPATKEG